MSVSVQYLSHVPPAPLSMFIEQLWSLRDAPAHATERIVPTGTLELVINLEEDRFRIDRSGTTAYEQFAGALVSGAYHRFFVIETRAHASIIGVHFKPGGARPFLGLPPGALADQHVDLQTLWGRSAGELRERLCDAKSAAARFTILEEALLARLRPRGGHDAVPCALEQLAEPGMTIGEVAARVQLSRRRLIEVVTADIGMTPKRLSRVLRFQRAIALARRSPRPDWARLAAHCGYFDQSHLNRDFRLLAGVSPIQFLRASEQVKEAHIAVSDDHRSKFSKTTPRTTSMLLA